jgi:hypothetical protein
MGKSFSWQGYTFFNPPSSFGGGGSAAAAAADLTVAGRHDPLGLIHPQP